MEERLQIALGSIEELAHLLKATLLRLQGISSEWGEAFFRLEDEAVLNAVIATIHRMREEQEKG